MNHAYYISTRPGLIGLANVLIRWRLRGLESHCELVFLPGDGVDHLMPDGTTQPVNGAYWCASSVAGERLPSWSRRRAGELGGVRFKRIVLDPDRWMELQSDADPVAAAEWVKSHEGALYDWRLIVGFIAWFFPNKSDRYTCHEVVAAGEGIAEGWRFDPCSLCALMVSLVARKLARR
jgi:hypothetical protein